MPTDAFSVIYSGNIVQADMLKSLLEGAGISALLEDEYLGKSFPYVASAGGVGAVKVVVAANEVGKARKIVEDFAKDGTT